MSANQDFVICRGTAEDLAEIKRLADANKKDLGFVLGATILDGLANERCFVARERLSGKVIGFVHFRHRRDGKTKLYQICVDCEFRRSGCGAALVETLATSARYKGIAEILLVCPDDSCANGFYERLGFVATALRPGRVRFLQEWKLPL